MTDARTPIDEGMSVEPQQIPVEYRENAELKAAQLVPEPRQLDQAKSNASMEAPEDSSPHNRHTSEHANPPLPTPPSLNAASVHAREQPADRERAIEGFVSRRASA